jgi:hypothetical protein
VNGGPFHAKHTQVEFLSQYLPKSVTYALARCWTSFVNVARAASSAVKDIGQMRGAAKLLTKGKSQAA